MIEFMPFAVAAALGALSSRYRVRLWPVLFSAAAVVLGVSATILSGEFADGWVFLPKDVVEAAVGLAFGMVVARANAHQHRL
jgi:hypothetical protein